MQCALARFMGTSLLSLGLLATPVMAEENALPIGDDPQGQAQPLPLDELRNFAEVYERIKQAYVEDIDDKTLLDNAIRGMLSGLDPHSSYLAPDDYTDLRESTEGEFGGLGIEIGSENGFLTIISPIDDTPASRAGLQPQDIILRINDTPVKSLPLDKAIEMMRGDPGTDITLTIMREGTPKPFDVTLTRAVIQITSVRHRMLSPGFGYLRITQFQANSGEEVRKAISQLEQPHATPLKGLVLDLRNNPGGVLQAAAEVVDTFVSSGLIVYTEGRLPDASLSFSAHAETAAGDIPLVVLINSGSASASEIVAGALQDHRRAILMGTPSFGKGSVQTILPLNGNRALKLTTALYYTPNGRSIQAQGIEPDIVIEQAKVTPLNQTQEGIREADLSGHLSNRNGGPERGGRDEVDAAKVPSAQDYQLNEALNLLKALSIMHPPKSTTTTSSEATDSAATSSATTDSATTGSATATTP